MFEMGILKSRSYTMPVISVGNITIGGAGKTPHVEYLIRLLRSRAKVAVLSRGYKRKRKGYVLADENVTAQDIGDEPFQMYSKYGHGDNGIYVAVNGNRCQGIDNLRHNEATKDTDVILLDDAFQHRYVKPGVNILLVDYHRLIIYDKLLPAGRLREPKDGKARADIVIVTKCPADLRPMNFRVITKAMALFPYQKLFFTTLKYGSLYRLANSEEKIPLEEIKPEQNVLLLAGIASPQQMILDLKGYVKNLKPMTYRDHHNFTQKDIDDINNAFDELPHPRIVVTTEKDAARLKGIDGLSDDVCRNTYVLPVEISFMLDQGTDFDDFILSYVQKNSKNSILSKMKNTEEETKSKTKTKTKTISFK